MKHSLSTAKADPPGAGPNATPSSRKSYTPVQASLLAVSISNCSTPEKLSRSSATPGPTPFVTLAFWWVCGVLLLLTCGLLLTSG